MGTKKKREKTITENTLKIFKSPDRKDGKRHKTKGSASQVAKKGKLSTKGKSHPSQTYIKTIRIGAESQSLAVNPL